MSDGAYPDKLTINLPEPYLTAIGRIVAGWGSLELNVSIGIHKLMGLAIADPAGMIVTAHMSWPQKMEVLESLIDERLPRYPHLAKFSELKPLLKQAQERRNLVAHGIWVYEDGNVSLLRATARGKLKTRQIPVSLEEIEEAVEVILRAGAATFRLIVNK